VSAKRSGTTAKNVLRDDVVSKYLDVLRRTSRDNAAFDNALLALKADKQVRTQEMREIASQFLGYSLAAKKARGAALQAIGNHQALDARQEARSRT
jgi:hypothetical protein